MTPPEHTQQQIVAWLRLCHTAERSFGPTKFSEAADMIEQLEAEVVECERVCSALRRGDKP
jgi:hypothetical protein